MRGEDGQRRGNIHLTRSYWGERFHLPITSISPHPPTFISPHPPTQPHLNHVCAQQGKVFPSFFLFPLSLFPLFPLFPLPFPSFPFSPLSSPLFPSFSPFFLSFSPLIPLFSPRMDGRKRNVLMKRIWEEEREKEKGKNN